MADFYQTGCVTTPPPLKPGSAARDGERAARYGGPCIDCSRSAGLFTRSSKTPRCAGCAGNWPMFRSSGRLFVALGRAGINEYRKVQEFFVDFPQKITVLWVDSPEIQNLLGISRSEACQAAPMEREIMLASHTGTFSQRATVM